MSDLSNLDDIIRYSRGLKLLYVEDNQDSREMTSMILEDFFDDMLIAVNGEDGFEKFKSNKIDIIITDINMPKLNGLEMIEKIKEIDNDIPILVLSAHNEDDFFIRSIRLGVDGYLLKPIDLDQLLNMLEKIVKRYKYINDAKSYYHLLEEYKKAANESSIVSKTDTKGIITYVNEKFCEISGYSKEELIGKNHNIIRHPDNSEEIFKDMWHTIKDKKEVWKGIIKNRTKDNKTYYVDSVIMPILDLDGNAVEYISLRHDVTQLISSRLKCLHNSCKTKEEILNLVDELDSLIKSVLSELSNKESEKIILEILDEKGLDVTLLKKLYFRDKKK